MNLGPLDPNLLKDVSRSFYLSVRVLPQQLQLPIGAAYLLARASDTIADSSSAPAALRLESLELFLRAVSGEPGKDISEVQQAIASDSPAEQTLLDRLPEVIQALQGVDARDWNDIQRLLRTIVTGQKGDLQQVHLAESAETGGVTALPNADALEAYAFAVAGSVGEFWTRLAFRHMADYSVEPQETLMLWGAAFGKGLQLVNILRDMPSDFALGRCYLPAIELEAAAVPLELLNTCPTGFHRVHDRWLTMAEGLLESGRHYIRSLRRRRMRMATYLPWALGKDTLALLRKAPAFVQATIAKVPKSNVRRRMIESVWVALGMAPGE